MLTRMSTDNIPGVVDVAPGRNGMPRVRVTSDLATAEIYLHGAQITAFQPRAAKPLLFLSEKSHFDPAKPIRGGVPLCFPWFGPKAGDPQAPIHGTARLKSWTLDSLHRDTGGAVDVALSLAADDADLRMTFKIGLGLGMELEVRARDPMTFEEAFHTYLVVGDVRQVGVDGLQNAEYIDKMDGFKRKTQPAEQLHITGETDRVFVNTTGTVMVHDPVLQRSVVVEKEGSASTVVWNPWIAKAKAMPDFGDEEWPGMLCIETANVGERAVRLEAGQTHRMRAYIGVLG